MDKKTVLTIAGIVAVIGGSICLYLAGTTEATITALVGGIFVIAGIIAGMFGKNLFVKE